MALTENKTWQFLQEHNLLNELIKGYYGIEVEAHRTTITGELSREPHPTNFGSRKFHPYMQTDYSETQTELVTEPATSFDEARYRLQQLQWVLRDALQPSENIWPISMPPKLSAADLEWLDTTFKRPWVSDYRDWLTDKYGSTHAIMTGPHVNFSLSHVLVDALFEASPETDKVTFINQLYFKVGQAINAHRWLFIYLFGASPYNFNDNDSRIPNDLRQPARSIRSSQYGFSNDADIDLAYDETLDALFHKMNAYIDAGQLHSDHEFYGTVRFKGVGARADVMTYGTQYLEIRVLDTDPFNPAGISDNALNLIQLLTMLFTVEDRKYTSKDMHAYAKLANEVALQAPDEPLPAALKAEAKDIVEAVSHLAESFGMRFNDGMSLLAERILNPAKTPAAMLVAKAGDKASQLAWAVETAKQNQEMFHVKQAALADEIFGDKDLMSTHIQALQLGLNVLAYSSTELKLKFNDHTEIVTQPTDLTQLFPEINNA
ncbi:MAG: glutamate--cysteine ligase [Lactobacillaceae bacterium]|jgi:glutamate--cysteine ligase|nr:glutamate--cysteine ligase [Lactobacillaceae bacterium]